MTGLATDSVEGLAARNSETLFHLSPRKFITCFLPPRGPPGLILSDLPEVFERQTPIDLTQIATAESQLCCRVWAILSISETLKHEVISMIRTVPLLCFMFRYTPRQGVSRPILPSNGKPLIEIRAHRRNSGSGRFA
jgi:hypothetical protein